MQGRVKPAQTQLVDGKWICSKSAGVKPEQGITEYMLAVDVTCHAECG